MSRHFSAEITDIRQLSREHFILTLHRPPSAPEPGPGQFFLIRLPRCGEDPLLRRPFSIFDWDEGKLRFFIRVAGKGTAILAGSGPGERIDLIGPLGRGYPEPSDGKRPVMVSGGMGIASLFPMIREQGKGGLLLYGARTSDELHLLDEIGATGIETETITDDGSSGRKGTVLDLLHDAVQSGKMEGAVVYGCGPWGMLHSLLGFLKENRMEGYLSLEERMACGLGACMGCAKEIGGRMLRVCLEGPVFSVSEF